MLLPFYDALAEMMEVEKGKRVRLRDRVAKFDRTKQADSDRAGKEGRLEKVVERRRRCQSSSRRGIGRYVITSDRVMKSIVSLLLLGLIPSVGLRAEESKAKK